MPRLGMFFGYGKQWACGRMAGVFAGLLAAGCSGGSIEAPTLSLPQLPDTSAITSSDAPIGSATEIYSRVALGANSCWFGAAGPLKKDYIYNASADAPSRGGKAEIMIHLRDPTQRNPRGVRAYSVKIDPDGDDKAKLAVENLKMPEAMATAMTSDVNRWARGDQGCAGSSTAAGWGAEAAAPEEHASQKPAKKKKKATKTKAPSAKVTTAR